MPTNMELNATVSINYLAGNTVIRGSGVLLSSGFYVLTVAHLFDDYSSGQAVNISSLNGETFNKADVFIHHGWDKDSSDFNHDIAIIKLSNQAATTGLSLWQDEDYVGVEFTLTGFGNDSGLHTGTNILDGDGSVFNITYLRSVIEGTQLIYDYDNGLEAQNSVYNNFGVPSSAIATDAETLAKLGDSGGPLLVNSEIAAISSYVFRNPADDINNIFDSSAGEIGVATRLYPYIPWVEYITQGNPEYIVPSTAVDVLTSIPEAFSGEIVNYFLLEMLLASTQTVRLQYFTRDGTAIAGVDYEYTEGWLELLPTETHKAIGVTVYGDIELEADEQFSLVVVDPSGQWFDSSIELVATHTIINNDLL